MKSPGSFGAFTIASSIVFMSASRFLKAASGDLSLGLWINSKVLVPDTLRLFGNALVDRYLARVAGATEKLTVLDGVFASVALRDDVIVFAFADLELGAAFLASAVGSLPDFKVSPRRNVRPCTLS